MAVLDSTNLTGCNAIPDFIAAGSLMFFQQTSAPTGWTKQTTHNDKALRFVSGAASSGGTFSFSSVFTNRTFTGTVGSHTLTTAQIPSHTHPLINLSPGDGREPADNPEAHFRQNGFDTATGATGGGGSHDHTFTGTALSFAVQYVDVIICSKNA